MKIKKGIENISLYINDQSSMDVEAISSDNAMFSPEQCVCITDGTGTIQQIFHRLIPAIGFNQSEHCELGKPFSSVPPPPTLSSLSISSCSLSYYSTCLSILVVSISLVTSFVQDRRLFLLTEHVNDRNCMILNFWKSLLRTAFQ